MSVDWDKIRAKLPIEKTPEGKAAREKLFKDFDPNGNGYLSLAEVEKGFRDIVKLDEIFAVKPVMMRAFQASRNFKNDNKQHPQRNGKATMKRQKRQNVEDEIEALLQQERDKKKGKKNPTNIGESYVEKSEFRMLLYYVRQYFELWQMFNSIDETADRRLDFAEFEVAVPNLERWGLKLPADANIKKEFDKIDKNGGGIILFDEFAAWAIDHNLDLEDDDDAQQDGQHQQGKEEQHQQQQQHQDHESQTGGKGRGTNTMSGMGTDGIVGLLDMLSLTAYTSRVIAAGYQGTAELEEDPTRWKKIILTKRHQEALEGYFAVRRNKPSSETEKSEKRFQLFNEVRTNLKQLRELQLKKAEVDRDALIKATKPSSGLPVQGKPRSSASIAQKLLSPRHTKDVQDILEQIDDAKDRLQTAQKQLDVIGQEERDEKKKKMSDKLDAALSKRNNLKGAKNAKATATPMGHATAPTQGKEEDVGQCGTATASPRVAGERSPQKPKQEQQPQQHHHHHHHHQSLNTSSIHEQHDDGEEEEEKEHETTPPPAKQEKTRPGDVSYGTWRDVDFSSTIEFERQSAAAASVVGATKQQRPTTASGLRSSSTSDGIDIGGGWNKNESRSRVACESRKFAERLYQHCQKAKEDDSMEEELVHAAASKLPSNVATSFMSGFQPSSSSPSSSFFSASATASGKRLVRPASATTPLDQRPQFGVRPKATLAKKKCTLWKHKSPNGSTATSHAPTSEQRRKRDFSFDTTAKKDSNTTSRTTATATAGRAGGAASSSSSSFCDYVPTSIEKSERSKERIEASNIIRAAEQRRNLQIFGSKANPLTLGINLDNDHYTQMLCGAGVLGLGLGGGKKKK